MTVRRQLACSVAALLLLSSGSAVLSLLDRHRASEALHQLQAVQQRQHTLASTNRALELRWREIRVLRELSPTREQIAVLRDRLADLDVQAAQLTILPGATAFAEHYTPLSRSWRTVLSPMVADTVPAEAPADPEVAVSSLNELRDTGDLEAAEASGRFLAAQQAADRTTLSFLAVSTICGLLVIIILSTAVTQGLATLENASRHVGEGDYGFRIAARGHDEFARAGETFNAMAEQLSSAIDEARRARAAAEQASDAKSGFLTSMSHDLRTPLTAVIGYADLIDAGARRAGLSGVAADVGQLRKSALVLLGMTGELLDLAKLEAGRMPVIRARVSVADLVDEASDTLQPLLAQRGNRITVYRYDSGAIVTDGAKVRHILQNLLGNACKFTERGEIIVRVTMHDGSGGAAGVGVTVTDSGIGMSAEAAARVFQPFEQADDAVRERFGGAGLGLSITRGFVDLLGGTIGVESRPGFGTTFSIWLPDSVADNDDDAFEAEAAEAAALFAALDGASAAGRTSHSEAVTGQHPCPGERVSIGADAAWARNASH